MKNLINKIKTKCSALVAKTYFMTTSIMLALTCPAYASGQGIVTGTSDQIFKKFIGEILKLATYVGVGMLAWGVISFFMAMRNEEAEKKTAAIFNIVAGIGIIGVKAILTAVGISVA
jgi:hypothetical protein